MLWPTAIEHNAVFSGYEYVDSCIFFSRECLQMAFPLRSLLAFALVLPVTSAWVANLFALSAAGTAISAGTKADEDDEASQALIATADFNRDGIADVARIRQPDGAARRRSVLQVSLGRQDGSFAAAVNHTLPLSKPRSIAAGDFNGDGNPDLLIGDADGALIALLGDGTGNLRTGGEIVHLGSAVSLAVGDFNRDGILDVAVSDFKGNVVTILLGSGCGSFRTAWSFPLPQRGTTYYLAAADFNNDQRPDLVITSGNDGTFVVMLGNGNGTFTYAPNLSNIRDPYSYCPT